MSFTAEDLERLCATQLDIGASEFADSLEWMRAREIEIDAMRTLLVTAFRKFAEKVAGDGDIEGAIYDVVGQSFRIGWEAALTTREPVA